MKSLAEKTRIVLSRIFALTFFGLLCVTSSYWETTSEMVGISVFFVSIVLVAIASLGRMWCSLYIAGYKDAELVTQGPYSLCRNPLYFFSLIGVVGVGCATETITIPIVLLVVFLSYYPAVIRGEEKRLHVLFGEGYSEYCKTTPALFPRRLKADEPEAYTVNPRVYRNHIFSALWFVWLVGLLEILEGLRELGLLNTYIVLP